MSNALTGAEFKKQLRGGAPKMGLFLNAHSPTVAEQLAHSGYDWLLVDTQHGPMASEKLSAMLCAIASGGAKSMVRVAGFDDRAGIQQALDMGADGVLIPYINTAEEARQAISCARYPTVGTRSVYFPQRSMNKAGLLGYAGDGTMQHHCRAAGGNRRPASRTWTRSPPSRASTSCFWARTICACRWGSTKNTNSRTCTPRPNWRPPPKAWSTTARKNNVILGLFLFGTARVGEFLEKGFTFISIGNDLHHVLTQAGAYVKDMEAAAAEKGKPWMRRPTALM